MATNVARSRGSAAIQGALWGADARTWSETQEPPQRPLWNSMLDAAGVGPGTRFFDAGCGAGGASELARARGATITGLDAAPPMIAIARERLPGADLRVGDLEDLPFADASFDVVFACNAIQFAADPVQALRELRRVCAPDGRVVVSTWGAAADCEYRDFLGAIRDSLPTPPHGDGPFALSAPGALEALLAEGGLTVADRREADCLLDYPDLETAWRVGRSAGPVQGALRHVDEATLKANVLAAIARYQSSDGSVRFKNKFVVVTAAP